MSLEPYRKSMPSEVKDLWAKDAEELISQLKKELELKNTRIQAMEEASKALRLFLRHAYTCGLEAVGECDCGLGKALYIIAKGAIS